MTWDAGTCDALFDRWSPKVAETLWGDQDWIGLERPDAETMPAKWFPRVSELAEKGPDYDARVVLCKKPKNTTAAIMYDWAREAWQ
jgi:hypothetical protein